MKYQRNVLAQGQTAYFCAVVWNKVIAALISKTRKLSLFSQVRARAGPHLATRTAKGTLSPGRRTRAARLVTALHCTVPGCRLVDGADTPPDAHANPVPSRCALLPGRLTSTTIRPSAPSCVQGIMNNRFMLFGFVFEACLVVLISYVPPLNIVFNTGPLHGLHWLPGIPFFIVTFLYDETRKWAMRRWPGGWVERLTYW